jgi:hypothetical protein
MREQTQQANSKETPASSIYAAYYHIIRETLGIIPYTNATREARVGYISWFDPVLGRLVTSGVSFSSNDEIKLGFLRKFEQAEWDFLRRRDDELIDKTFLGAWGAFMRDQRVAEEEFRVRYEKAESEAQQSLMFKSFVGYMGAMGSPGGMVYQYKEQMREVVKIREELVRISKTFQQQIENEVEKELRFVFDIGGETVEVRARSLEELRFKMKRLYEKRFAPDSSER